MDGRPVPLASAHLEEHLAGAYHVAIDPLLPDGTVRFLVISLHSRAARTWKTDSLQLAIAARRLGIPLLLERTRTGNGLHAWVFFSSKVTASDARRLGAALLAEAGDGDPLRVRSFDRLYPRDPAQASTPDASVEDVVALPLQGALRSRNLTVFVRPQRGLPTIADQWTLLSLLPRLDVGLVQEIVRHAVREGPAPQRPSPATERRPRAPLEVTLSASLAVPRPLPRQVAAWLRETLATPNPAYQRRREQDWSSGESRACSPRSSAEGPAGSCRATSWAACSASAEAWVLSSRSPTCAASSWLDRFHLRAAWASESNRRCSRCWQRTSVPWKCARLGSAPSSPWPPSPPGECQRWW